jgi:hypothetical protein
MLICELIPKQSIKEGYDLAGFSAPAATLGPNNHISPVGSVPKGQRINTKRPKKVSKK